MDEKGQQKRERVTVMMERRRYKIERLGEEKRKKKRKNEGRRIMVWLGLSCKMGLVNVKEKRKGAEGGREARP
jgi:hypothetical protein